MTVTLQPRAVRAYALPATPCRTNRDENPR